jgi:hypothetical protein
MARGTQEQPDLATDLGVTKRDGFAKRELCPQASVDTMRRCKPRRGWPVIETLNVAL